MTCRDALLLLEFARPGATELEAADIAALETHLADCRPCSAFASAERQLGDRLIAAFQNMPPAANGKTVVLNRLTNRSRAWHRQKALVMGIVAFAGVSIWGAIPGPKLDPDSILAAAQDQIGDRNGTVKSWLAAQDSRFQLASGFRSEYLVSYERRAIHGTTAPVLIFVRGDALARVTVLTSGQLRNLSQFADGHVAENSVGTIMIVRDPAVPGVVYLVEVINGTVDRFYNTVGSTVT